MNTSSRDWGHELVQSLIWLSWVVPLTFVAAAVIIALLLRTTKWGRQVWNISGGYFRGPDAWKVHAMLALLLLFSLSAVRLNVLFSYWSNDFYNSLQFAAQAIARKDNAGLDDSVAFFWSSLGLFGVLATIHVARSLIAYFIGEWFEIRWRLWLTDNVTADWLTGNAYYRNRFIDETIDNPDQRIQADITNFVGSSRSLAFGAISSVVTIFAFVPVLWKLSGTLTVFGFDIPRAMMILVLTYVVATTIVAFWLGRPLIRLNFLYEAVTATFRYALVRVREGAENIAFYRGEDVERAGLFTRFRAVIAQYWRIVYRTLKFDGWNLSVNQLAVIFPWLIQGPRFFAGQVTFGDVTQTDSAFGQIHDSLSFFREAYSDFAAYRASTMRLHGLLEADDESRDLPKIAKSDVATGVELTNVDVRRPDGVVLIDDLDLRLVAGDALVVKGASGTGKTTLLRTLAQIWPFADGAIAAPAGNETLFLSQIPYLPLGDLRMAVAYPAEVSEFDDEVLQATLAKVSLPHLVDQLDVAEDWSKVLSPGEQQRIAFARILLIRPAVVFLDEATSAIDEGLEYGLYQLIRTELPETILVSVAHRSTVDVHHTQKLELSGTGAWELAAIAR
ncbi:MAG TPA: ABC transporter ATP-binding protein/permease [Aeromicrobium sp.]|nr:ABC transporter ATP-binding protein/permease [Aeromicrobium sp.]